MLSRVDRGSVRHQSATPRGWVRSSPRSTKVGAMTVLLLVAILVFAATASIAAAQDAPERTDQSLPQQARIVALLQVSIEIPQETQEPAPEPPDETAEPTASETPEPPVESTQPTPGNTSIPEATAGGTPQPERTAEPSATHPAGPTATATAGWPLGTIRLGPEETAPPAEPIRLTITEWLRLALVLVIVTLVAIFGGRLLHRLLGSVIRRQHLAVDETLLVELRPLLSWWLAVIAFHVAVWWVNPQNEPARELLADLVFFAYLGVATLTAWRLVDRAIDLYATRIGTEGRAAIIEKLDPLMRRWARVLILVLSGFVALGRLGIGLSVPTLLVALIGLTISLAARDTLTDVIAGLFILVDQPFRIGDRIEVQDVDTWAEVVNIGLRTSALRTRHNVEIIVPNSRIGKNQVINYGYPDPRYRMQTHVGVAFGTNIEHARRVMIDAVRQADGVLPDEPVEALYVEIGDSAMIFRVRWWIDFRGDWESVYDRIHTALHKTLGEAGIESPYPSQSLYLEVDDQAVTEVWQAWQGGGENGSSVVGEYERAAQ